MKKQSTKKHLYFIRRIEPADKERFEVMWKKYLQFYHADFDANVCENTWNQFLSNNETIGCLVACHDDNEAIGFLTYVTHLSTWRINPVCYLHDLFVEEEYRQGGIAQQLVTHLTSIAKTHHWSRIYWLTKPDNLIARKFYDKIAQSDTWIKYSITMEETQ